MCLPQKSFYILNVTITQKLWETLLLLKGVRKDSKNEKIHFLSLRLKKLNATNVTVLIITVFPLSIVEIKFSEVL